MNEGNSNSVIRTQSTISSGSKLLNIWHVYQNFSTTAVWVASVLSNCSHGTTLHTWVFLEIFPKADQPVASTWCYSMDELFFVFLPHAMKEFVGKHDALQIQAILE